MANLAGIPIAHAYCLPACLQARNIRARTQGDQPGEHPAIDLADDPRTALLVVHQVVVGHAEGSLRCGRSDAPASRPPK